MRASLSCLAPQDFCRDLHTACTVCTQCGLHSTNSQTSLASPRYRYPQNSPSPHTTRSTLYLPFIACTTHHGLIMSQAQTPREYKFVGAFSRKRRRRNGHILTTEPGYCVGAAASPPTPRESTIRPTTTTASSTYPAVTRPANISPALHASTPLLPQPQTNSVYDGAVTGFLDSGPRDEADWAFSGLMNPFLDADPLLMAPFDLQPPIQFESDVPALQLDDRSSSSNSPRDDHPDHEEGHEQTPHSFMVDEIVLPPISAREAPSNITSTITQLRSRCACQKPFPSHAFRVSGSDWEKMTGNFALCL